MWGFFFFYKVCFYFRDGLAAVADSHDNYCNLVPLSFSYFGYTVDTRPTLTGFQGLARLFSAHSNIYPISLAC